MSAWETARLGDVVDIFDHKRVPLSSAQRTTRKGPFPYYGAQGVIDHINDFIFDGRFILVPEDGENLRSRKLPIAYFAEGQFWVNNHAHIIKAKPGLAVDRFVQSAIEATSIGAWVTGAAQPKLSQANLREIPVLLPSYRDQQLISSILDAFDDLIENNRRRVDVLEELARTIFREWFVHFRYPGHENAALVDSVRGQVPMGWGARTSGDLMGEHVLDIGDGYRAKNSEMTGTDDGLPFVRVGNVRGGRLSLAGCDRLPDEYRTRLRSKLSRPGDVVISMKGTVGRHALIQGWDPEVAYSPQVSFWRSLAPDVYSPEYLYLWIQSDDFVEQCAAVKGATDMADYVNLTDQRRMILVEPPRELMATFTATVRSTVISAANLRSQGAQLALLRDMLLPKLVTGQIDVSSLDLDALVEEAVA